jgi:hypothetical protein
MESTWRTGVGAYQLHPSIGISPINNLHVDKMANSIYQATATP